MSASRRARARTVRSNKTKKGERDAVELSRGRRARARGQTRARRVARVARPRASSEGLVRASRAAREGARAVEAREFSVEGARGENSARGRWRPRLSLARRRVVRRARGTVNGRSRLRCARSSVGGGGWVGGVRGGGSGRRAFEIGAEDARAGRAGRSGTGD